MPKTTAARLSALTVLTAVALACGAAGAATASADVPGVPSPPQATVTVTGDGSVTGDPDMAVATVGVEVTRPTAAAASSDEAAAAQALLDAMHAQGIADKDLVTQSLGLQPVYDYSNSTPKVIGYAASESFAVTVRDIAKAGDVIQAAVAATGDAGRVTGVSFGLSDHALLRAQARAAAMADAYAKAAQYADLSGHSLGDVLSVSETGGSALPPPAFAPPGAAAAPPIATGQIRDEANVTVVYELGPRT